MRASVGLTTLLALAAVIALRLPPSAAAAPASAASCQPAGDLRFVCGLVNVEDFVPVAGGRWLLGGSYQAGSAGLYLIDTAAKTAKTVALSLAAKRDPALPCEPPDLGALVTHGLDLAPGSIVYAVNHGGRESVEVFHLDAARGAAEWVGCAVLPAGASGNSVAALGNGEFVVTKFLDPADQEAFQHILAGKINGTVYRFTPGKGFSEIPGTQLSGDNGIVVSPDRHWLFVNAYGTHEIYRVPLDGHGQRDSAKVDFSPDNLRWTPDGQLFVTGQFVSAANLTGAHGWATVRLDPKTLRVTPLVQEPGLPEFDNATSAVQVGDTLWFGTFKGDRVAYRKAP